MKPRAHMSAQRKRNARRTLIRRYGPFCARCGRTAGLTIDHVIPVSRGGTHRLSNLQLLCEDCNADKSNRLDAAPGWAA